MARVHVIAEGECLSSVAFENGYFPGTIWERPENDALRELRGDPNVLSPGDKLFVPDKEPKTTTCATGKVHRFTRRGVPARRRGLGRGRPARRDALSDTRRLRTDRAPCGS